MGQHIKRKAFKTEIEAEKYRLELCTIYRTPNIIMRSIKSAAVEAYGSKMYSYLNKDIVNKQGHNEHKGRELSRMMRIYPDKPVKLISSVKKINIKTSSDQPLSLLAGIMNAYKLGAEVANGNHKKS